MGIYISKLTDSPSAAVNTQSQPQANGEFKALMNEFSSAENEPSAPVAKKNDQIAEIRQEIAKAVQQQIPPSTKP